VKFRTQIPEANIFGVVCPKYKKKNSHPGGNQSHLPAIHSVPADTTTQHQQINKPFYIFYAFNKRNTTVPAVSRKSVQLFSCLFQFPTPSPPFSFGKRISNSAVLLRRRLLHTHGREIQAHGLMKLLS
jgi:hypothetical protein